MTSVRGIIGQSAFVFAFVRCWGRSPARVRRSVRSGGGLGGGQTGFSEERIGRVGKGAPAGLTGVEVAEADATGAASIGPPKGK